MVQSEGDGILQVVVLLYHRLSRHAGHLVAGPLTALETDKADDIFEAGSEAFKDVLAFWALVAVDGHVQSPFSISMSESSLDKKRKGSPILPQTWLPVPLSVLQWPRRSRV